jgi:hypothetical protein
MADRKEAFDRDVKYQLDRELDAALAKYAAVEPRVGLEGRVLANMQIERAKDSRFAPWFSYAAGALAVAFVALALAWTLGTLHAPPIASHPRTAAPNAIQSGSQGMTGIRTNDAHSQKLQPAVRRATLRRRRVSVAAANPKLERFPSPQPLSAQEQILQDYVADYPEQAVLVARARTEELQRDAEQIRLSESNEVGAGR